MLCCDVTLTNVTGYEDIYEEECDISPIASMFLSEQSTGWLSYSDFSSDPDGEVVRWDLWINNQYKGAFYNQSDVKGSQYFGTFATVSVKVKVTDNDGHTDTRTWFYTLNAGSCSRFPNSIDCL